MHRAAGLLTATALTMAALTACGSESEPGPSISTASPIDRGTDEPSGSPSASGDSNTADSPDIPELPPEATERSKAGAIAFNEAYQQMLGHAMRTGETATLKKVTSDCDVCDNFIQETESNLADGITMDRAPYSARDLSATARDDGGYKVTLTVESSGFEAIQDGSTVGRAEPSTYTLVTDTQWRAGHWVIHDSVIIE